MFSINASTTIPTISSSQNRLTIKAIILIALRRSLFHTQIMERSRPIRVKKIFVPAQMVRISFGRAILRNAGIRVASGRTLIVKATMFNFPMHLFFISYLISFFPNCVVDMARATAKTAIAQGKNGNSENAIVVPSVAKSYNEQDTKYPL